MEALSYRFNFKDEDSWKDHLAEHGFVVVSGVVSEEECQVALRAMKETLVQFSPALKLNSEQTWISAKNYPFMLHGGMIQYVGHAKFQWQLREMIAPVFGKVWNCDVMELATSFDGFCYMDGRRRYKEGDLIGFVHSDQAPTKNYLWSVQGLVNLCDSGENDGGLVIVPDTHKIHHEYFGKLGKTHRQNDWYKFTDEEKKDEVFKTAIKVCGKAGDFMMWDSRTFHCNTVPTTRNARACVYICQLPKEKISSAETFKLRRQAWTEKRCCNHYPGDGLKVFPAVPRFADPTIRDVVPRISIQENELTELQRSLMCI